MMKAAKTTSVIIHRTTAIRHATLADSFLADLEDLSDNELDVLEEGYADAGKMEEDIDGLLADIESLNYDDFDNVAKLQKTQRYNDILQKVEDALEKGSKIPDHGIFLEDDPEYKLIVNCNALSVDIENEISIIHNFIRDKYCLKFPELESLVHHPIDYARVVKKIGNEMDLTLVDLQGLLPSAIIMVVSVILPLSWSFQSLHQQHLVSHYQKTFCRKLLRHVIVPLILIHQGKKSLILWKVEWFTLHQIFPLLLDVLLQQSLWGPLEVCRH